MNTTEGKTEDNHKKAKTAAEQTQKCFGIREQRGAESQASWDYTRKKNVLLVLFSRNNQNAQGNGTLGIGMTVVWSTVSPQPAAEMHLVHFTYFLPG